VQVTSSDATQATVLQHLGFAMPMPTVTTARMKKTAVSNNFIYIRLYILLVIRGYFDGKYASKPNGRWILTRSSATAEGPRDALC